MRVLVCGGRDFVDRKFLEEVLDDLNTRRGPFEVVIHGGARGADTLAGLWAKRRGVPIELYPADWGRHGRSAGPVRNAEMLTRGRPDLIIAFPGGAGTADMVRQGYAAAREANIEIIIHRRGREQDALQI